MTDYSHERREMVEHQLAARGIRDPAVLAAFGAVPREEFISRDLVHHAYADVPLPIGWQQTISQPYVVALMTEALELSPEDRVLEIGTGSGYSTAILTHLCAEVYTIERNRTLAHRAASRLARLGYTSARVRHGDGTRGWPEHAPFDGVIVAAGGPNVPEALKSQLALGGRLVMPVGAQRTVQRLKRVRRSGRTSFVEEDLGVVRFVPLIGEHGWRDNPVRECVTALALGAGCWSIW